MPRFPDGFLWGAATAAYQVEGGNAGSTFAAWEKVRGWEPCGLAADSWRRWPEDIRCLRELGLGAYRFSVEWSRVEPRPGEYDEAALARYREQVRALAEAGIRPMVCLHHFSEPAWLYELEPSGWTSPRCAGYFLRFVERVLAAFQGEVRDWLTFNEPMVWLLLGYGLGHFPPGLRSLFSLERVLGENGPQGTVLRAHEEAYRLIHRAVPAARVSVAQNIVDLRPASGDPADARAVRDLDLLMHGRFLDRAHAAKTLDFIGVNYYTGIFVRAARLPLFPAGALPGYAELERALGPRLFRLLGGRRGEAPRSDMGWEVVPEGLGRVVRRVWAAYGLPIFITENGVADGTGELRAAFLQDHLAALRGEIERGARVLGYLHWSLLDNYEWGSFRPRFGLYSVDRAGDFARRPAPGARAYADIVRENEGGL
ncbi:MAG: hypothetical protein A2X36_16830 [Elusimicrobia bacterium GWA2_69_24]|nr:MAG: hypothetical protein A2X36_16830 [Elusimicrobia bacterium GWA2_69_24]HBL16620.1 hypothetical protein [Elusimicrobiota bacterium]